MKGNRKNTTKSGFTLFIAFMLAFNLTGIYNPANARVHLGGVDFGNLVKYHMVFTKANMDANIQGSTRGFLGDIAINGVVCAERSAGSVAFAGTMYTNDATLGAWQNIVNANASQANGSVNNTSLIDGLNTDLENVFSQINALAVTTAYNGVTPVSLNGMNTQNNIKETFVINLTSGFTVSSMIQITGDASDIYIFRWDSDANFSNGYNGEVRFKNGGAFVPKGELIASNFIHVAGDIKCSGGGYNPPLPYPQGPRKNNGTGDLITGALDFTGGGFFTGFWFTTGVPTIFPAGLQPYGKTGSLTNGIFVGGWYTKTNDFSLVSGSSGVYVAPTGSIGNRIWNDIDGNGTQEEGETVMENITVNLISCSGSLVATTTSAPDGSYMFKNVWAGDYYIQFMAPPGYEFTLPIQNDDTTLDSDVDPETGFTKCITLQPGEMDTTRDAGLNQNASIGNFVWNDLNANGIQDPSETGVVNVLVELRTCGGDYINSTMTNYDGQYLFSNITPGEYSITYILPQDFSFSANNQGSNQSKDSDPDPSNGTIGCVLLKPGEYKGSVDAGIIYNGTGAKLNSGNSGMISPNTIHVEARSFPNPFVESTTIEFKSTQNSEVGSVEIYSLDGRRIAELFHSTIESNTVYQAKWDATNVPNGIYMYKIVCDAKVTTGKLVLVK